MEKEVQQQQSAGFDEFLAWLVVNKTRVLVGILVAAIVGLGTYGYFVFRDHQETAGSQALSALGPSAKVADYLKVAQEHGGTRAGEQAQYLAAVAQFSDNKYAEAQKQFGLFLEQHGDSLLAPDAALGLAASLESQNKLAEALAKYQDASRRYVNKPVAAKAKLGIARIEEAQGHPENALRIYRELSQSQAAGGSRFEVQSRLEQLLKKHPGLEGTNSAPKPLKP